MLLTPQGLCVEWAKPISPQCQPLLHLPEKTCVELVQRLEGGEDGFLQRLRSRLILSHSILERLRSQIHTRIRGQAIKIHFTKFNDLMCDVSWMGDSGLPHHTLGCILVITTRGNLIFKGSAEETSSFSRFMWKQPHALFLHIEGQTFMWSSNR